MPSGTYLSYKWKLETTLSIILINLYHMLLFYRWGSWSWKMLINLSMIRFPRSCGPHSSSQIFSQPSFHCAVLSPYRHVWRGEREQSPHQVSWAKPGKTELIALTNYLTAALEATVMGTGLHAFPAISTPLSTQSSWSEDPDNWGDLVSSHHQATARFRVSTSVKTHLNKHQEKETTSPHPGVKCLREEK